MIGAPNHPSETHAGIVQGRPHGCLLPPGPSARAAGGRNAAMAGRITGMALAALAGSCERPSHREEPLALCTPASAGSGPARWLLVLQAARGNALCASRGAPVGCERADHARRIRVRGESRLRVPWRVPSTVMFFAAVLMLRRKRLRQKDLRRRFMTETLMDCLDLI
jgi:hypothetical protein